MVTGTLDELRRCVGKEGEPFKLKVDNTAVRLLLAATGDQNPMWQDASAVPPYLVCATMVTGRAVWPDMPWPSRRGVDGGGEWEILAPINRGDEITSVCKLKDLNERGGKSGKMFIATMETTVRNQDGVVVAKGRSTTLDLIR